MALQFFNSLTRKKEIFTPIHPPIVSLYTCGPTVYDAAHIGNFRAYIFNDLLKRVLFANKFQVTHVMNITDVDDKTIKRSAGQKNAFTSLTRNVEADFWDEMRALNTIKPDVVTRATEYIDQMVAFIQDLLQKGIAYKGEDGSLYFAINKFPQYGKLSQLEKKELRVGARVSQDEYSKENPADFALWKMWNSADGDIFWDTPLGRGRPGWHIECSVMASA
ncbi:MAG TPA: cysteine--tRNA ligase, partial [Patescibacteria group bacterium]|nr:cysteine--tRNA ligase [Patescibacteria group bacterium]